MGISEGIIIATITVAGTIISQLILANKTKDERDAEEAVKEANLNNKLDQIQSRLDTHNHYAEKIGSIEDSLLLIQQDIKYIKEGKFKDGN